MNSYDIFINDILPKLNTFDDFYKINGYTTKQIGDFFEIITKYIFMLHDNYKLIVDKVWLYDQIPNNLFKELNIPVRDKGIDLVVLMKDRSYYAVQSKFRSNMDETITWKELATFVGMTFGVGEGFRGGFFVTNTKEIDVEIRRCKERIVPIYDDFFDTLDNNFFEQIRALTQNMIIKPHKSHPKRDYQIEFLDKCIAYYQNNTRGYGNISCGVGKTLMSYWYHKHLNPKFTIIGVPSLYLLSQFFKEWIREATADNYQLEFLLVGSDTDFKTEDYQNNGLIITTDEKEICKKFCNAIFRSNKNLVIITTYQSADKLLFASEALNITYDLCILDEAHKTCQQLGHQFSFLLDDKNLKINKRLSLTATPKIYKNTGDDNEDIVSMDNKKIFGEEIFKYSMRQGITGKYLCDYQIMTLFTENKYVKDYIENSKLVKSSEIDTSDSYYLACALMIIKAFEEHGCTHMITYHNTVKNSERMEDLLKKLLPYTNKKITILQIDGDTKIKDRVKRIKEFQSAEYAILTTARVLNEGINIPIIDSVCFVDQRDSTIDIIQCIGRSIRPCDGKQMAKVLVPYFFEDINKLSDNFYFSKLVNIIKAISESDEDVNEYFTLKTNGKAVNRPIVKHCNYLSDETKVIINEKINLDEWFDKIDISVWKKVDITYLLNKIKDFIELNKKVPNKRSDNNEEKQLGYLCHRLRQNKKNGRLSNDIITFFNNIELWKWEPLNVFPDNYERLKKFIETNNKLPSSTSKDETEKNLGIICRHYRQDYKLNKLTDEQILKLSELPHWIWKSNIDRTKQDLVTRVNDYKIWIDTNNRMPTLNKESKQEMSLAKWFKRTEVNKTNNKLSTEQVELFNQINIDNYKNKKLTREEKNNILKNWILKNKQVPSICSRDGYEKKLGRKCDKLRKKKKENMLTNDEINFYESLYPYWYWDQDDKIRQKVKVVDQWIEEHGRPPHKSGSEYSIYVWYYKYKVRTKK
ncbi:superfamily II helicase [Klosneuvirus KNV1]|uniref:Superfamily II helicase n=1 Tax=Klosneuvirus KNV1 TaxID=1977640 RepID=A0A1V0SHP4_9VIRU|nr:superfamily II helicase [Klosneuvirus KNV1]